MLLPPPPLPCEQPCKMAREESAASRHRDFLALRSRLGFAADSVKFGSARGRMLCGNAGEGPAKEKRRWTAGESWSCSSNLFIICSVMLIVVDLEALRKSLRDCRFEVPAFRIGT